MAAILSGFAVLNLTWFTAALRTTLAEADQDGWGAAATAASAALGASFLLILTTIAALTYSIAGSGNHELTSALKDIAWAGVVLSSFPRAMLIMAAAFGLWRAKLTSNALFAVGVAAVVLELLGSTTWLSSGFWAADGVYSRFISPVIGLAWILVLSRVLLTRRPAARAWKRRGYERVCLRAHGGPEEAMTCLETSKRAINSNMLLAGPEFRKASNCSSDSHSS